MGLLGMVEATIEDLACTGAKLFLKTHLESFEITGTRMLLREGRVGRE